MSQLTGTGPKVVAQGLFDEKSTALHNLGEIVYTNDGRAFRYVKAGGTALVAGNLQQASAQDTGDQNLAIAAAAVGAKQIVTTSTVTVTANQYAGGFALITTSDGAGYIYPITGHAAATTAVVTLNLGQAINVALTTSSKVDLIKNPYDGVVNCPTTLTSAPVGVAPIALTASYFGWIQVSGPANVEAEGALTVGLDVVASDADAGCVEVIADGAAELLPKVGKALTTVSDGEFGAVKLELL